ncbi:ATP-binding protein [Nocardia arthritidis]|uniref:ATP-binding protein n=1 Tax=Nocardia arthritidis TaxID=228602 RepID=A0A6G9Y8L0_9NOCA|nr:ATP-binding protein [Nocardia arthritidis]QIS09605.1 ATP-binding protein [Nocardia arthritidis]
MRYFNTAGPCLPDLHYMIPAEERLPDARMYIEFGFYIVVHAPRQSGKTTALLGLARELTAEGHFLALSFSCELGEALRDDYTAVEEVLLSEIRRTAELQGWAPELLPPDPWPEAAPGSRLVTGLTAWVTKCPRPLVLFFDEIDALRGDSLISVLRQLRAGYTQSRQHFVHSVVLCGLRDVREYKAASGGDPKRLGTASPFNIKIESIRVGDFTKTETCQLYRQHTTETGQEFDDKALDLAFYYTQGQPWLVNALAWEITGKMRVRETITIDHVEQAKERLILSRATHLDSLVDKLNDPRVQRVLTPILVGAIPKPIPEFDDDITYVRDLGLVAQGKQLRIANPIYQEVIVRVLGDATEASITAEPSSFRFPDGRIDFPRLLREFTTFWIQHGDILAARENYHEVAAQLVLMAYLHRIVNGAGYIDREVGVGRGRIDLLVRQPYSDDQGHQLEQREALELKVWADHQADPLNDGLTQLDGYLDRLGLDTGTLVIFDRRPTAAPIATRTGFDQAHTPGGRTVTLLRA